MQKRFIKDFFVKKTGTKIDSTGIQNTHAFTQL